MCIFDYCFYSSVPCTQSDFRDWQDRSPIYRDQMHQLVSTVLPRFEPYLRYLARLAFARSARIEKLGMNL